MEKHKKLIRGKLIYYVTDSAVIVRVGKYQFISYNVYNSPSRSDLSDFKRRLLSSRPDQYGDAIEMINFARHHNLVGSGVRRPGWIKEDK